MEKGRLIVLEGSCDGIGKTTQYYKLSERLKYEGKEIVSHHFPSYNTYHGALVEKYLSGEMGTMSELSPYFINSLYAVDRGVVWQTQLKKAYEEGKFILLDRYTTSSLIYQASMFDDKEEVKAFLDYVTDFEYNKIGIKKPDDVIYLHVPFDLATKMRNARKYNEGVENDLHERDQTFMRRVYDTSVFVADYLDWSTVECSKNNTIRTIDDIHEEVYSLVKTKRF